MFDHLFKSSLAVALHANAPYAEERIRYLEHCERRGDKHHTVRRKAWDLLWIAHQLSERADLHLTVDQLRSFLFDPDRKGIRHRQIDSYWTRRQTISTARGWLRYLGCLDRPGVQIPFQSHLDDYCKWATNERGLAESTVGLYARLVTRFLLWYGPGGRSLSQVRVSDIDAYLAYGRQRGWGRFTIRTAVDAMRAFFRFGGLAHWCEPSLAAAIQGPRIYSLESLPAGPTWADVSRVFAGLNSTDPKDVRDRAILMLLAIYGMRATEVAKLRLDDIDWERDQLRVRRAKRQEPQVYPLLPSVGKAIVDYLQGVRPRSAHREVFLMLMSPFRPLSATGIYGVVSPRLKAADIHCAHHGPHALRHACAARLVAQGLSLKEIGDHLGHRSTDATRIYTKVDLAGLREVAAFDLGELS
ncbi:Integrase family protein [Paraburkholderia piptadeniae]|uniref:Integrase family protein n=1 Tax=Paraburkholderia piptadeniae TaxID=1701573 RepID=A0A1N7SWK9_9BURK|nr:site-specific integrase [Paraburkholderia piptadeniae]SIT51742.1 Integrase family protein [Paraburkholderia piptadeniae]